MTQSPSVEVELKLGLDDPSSLGALLAVLPEPETVREQRNVYLEDPGAVLAEARVMVRVREAWDVTVDPPRLAKIVMTIKRRTAVQAGVFTAEEREQAVPVQAWRAFERGERGLVDLAGPAMDWLRANHPVRALSVLGEMTNRRHEIHADGLVLEVDRTTFPGGQVEVEVECETLDVDKARAVIEGAARDAGVTLFEQRAGKFERFRRYASLA